MELEERLENRLMSHGVYVREVDAGDTLDLTYETVAPGEGVPHRDIGRIVNLLREMREQGDWEHTPIRGEASDPEGEYLGTWHVEVEWLEALQEEDLSEVAFSQRVLDTIEEAEG